MDQVLPFLIGALTKAKVPHFLGKDATFLGWMGGGGWGQKRAILRHLNGTELAILNWELAIQHRAIPRSRQNIDRIWIGDSESIFHDFVYCDLAHVCTSRYASSGDCWPTSAGIVRFAIRDSVLLSAPQRVYSFLLWRLLDRVHCIGNSCEFWRFSLEKPTQIHHNSPKCLNYDGFLWAFLREVVRIRMNSRDFLCDAPGQEVYYCFFLSALQSAPAEGQQQQLKTTSDVTSKFPWCCRASVLWSGKEALDAASDDPPDEALSCRPLCNKGQTGGLLYRSLLSWLLLRLQKLAVIVADNARREATLQKNFEDPERGTDQELTNLSLREHHQIP